MANLCKPKTPQSDQMLLAQKKCEFGLKLNFFLCFSETFSLLNPFFSFFCVLISVFSVALNNVAAPWALRISWKFYISTRSCSKLKLQGRAQLLSSLITVEAFKLVHYLRSSSKNLLNKETTDQWWRQVVLFLPTHSMSSRARSKICQTNDDVECLPSHRSGGRKIFRLKGSNIDVPRAEQFNAHANSRTVYNSSESN